MPPSQPERAADLGELDFATLAAHAGLEADIGAATSTVPPIVPSTTFLYSSVEEIHAVLAPQGEGFAYGRNANPTVATLEAAVAPLEGAECAVAFASGMAAIHAALLGTGLKSGDTVLAAGDLYGVTRSLFLRLADLGIRTVFVDVLDLDRVEAALRTERPRLLYFETISNPLLRIADIERLAAAASRHGALALVDNTFGTPYLVRPLSLGAHVVIHSATKYLAGHGDVIAGVVATDETLGRRIRDLRTLTGGIMSPFDAWLVMRGLRTLPLRLDRQGQTALALAGWLEERPWVRRVYYPALAGNAHYDLASRQFQRRLPGMLAFDLDAEEDGTCRFIDALRLIAAGTSIGDVASLVLYPPRSSHRGMNQEELAAAGIGPGLVRLSVGVEAEADLRRDLQLAAQRSGLEGKILAENI